MRAATTALLTLLVAACGGDPETSAVRDVPPGMPAEGALLRLPSEGGRAQLYRADSLTPLDWQIGSGVPEIAAALGTDLEDRMVYALDPEGRLVGIDLLARRSRIYVTTARQLTSTLDGVVLGLDSARRAVRFSSRDLTTFRVSVEGGGTPRLLRGPGAQIAAYLPDAGLVQLLSEDGEVRRFTAPRGEAQVTWHGDLMVVTTDSGLVFLDPSAREQESRFVRLRGSPITAAFSPSAHRLYVARGRGDIVIVDRFSGDDIGTIRLPAAAKALRPDRSGRWMLALPENGDSVWVIDLVRRERALTIVTPWAEDLPLITGGRTLVVRDRDDVVAWELTGARPVERTRLVGAGGDVFLAIPWSPEDAHATRAEGVVATAPPAAERIPEEVAVAPDTPDTPQSPDAPAPRPAAGGSGTGTTYLQISSSQNREWAEALASQLRDGGFPARLLNPDASSDAYRVVVGPYGSREDADAAGRRLGRPYFVVTEPPTGT